MNTKGVLQYHMSYSWFDLNLNPQFEWIHSCEPWQHFHDVVMVIVQVFFYEKKNALGLSITSTTGRTTYRYHGSCRFLYPSSLYSVLVHVGSDWERGQGKNIESSIYVSSPTIACLPQKYRKGRNLIVVVLYNAYTVQGGGRDLCQTFPEFSWNPSAHGLIVCWSF